MDNTKSSDDVVEADVMVVGSGAIAGVLVCAMASAGLRVALVGGLADTTVQDGGVLAISAASRPLFEGLDLWDDLAAQAEPILDFRVVDGVSRLFLHYDQADLGFEPFGWTIANNQVRDVLTARLAMKADGVTVIPASVLSLDFGTDGVQARLTDGRQVAARVLAAADGINSPTRLGAGIGVIGWETGQTTIVCDIEHATSHDGFAYEHFLPGGPFVVLPMTGERASVAWTERHLKALRLLDMEEGEFLAALRKRLDGVLGELTQVGPRRAIPVCPQIADAYVGKRLALVGEAALSAHPVVGHGFDQACRDVAALAEVLADAARIGLDIGETGILMKYQRWRRPDAIATLVAAEAFNRLFSNDFAPLRFGRDLGLALVNKVAPVKKALLQRVTGFSGEVPRLLRGENL
ncbi:MAG: FAD-dependent monooxygenase [Alphaproteobacteria bacterium]|nr:FAD-dependent monooxygenase [Alphaproteobacteria bacterium]